MVFAKVAVSTAIIVVALAFLLYQHAPEGLEDRRLYQVTGIVFNVLNLISTIPSVLFGWHFDLQRAFVSQSMPVVHHRYPDLEVNDYKFEGVPVRVYKHKSVKVPSPAVVFIHGGGWVMNNIDTYDSTTVPLAVNTSMIVISVDYRLAPEHPYPAPFEDCVKATKYVLKNGNKYGIDVDRVAIVGESSGGNLATAVAYKLSHEKSDSTRALKLQVLIYPVTQVVNFKTSSYVLYKNNPVLNRRFMVTYVASYLLQDLSSGVLTAIMENRHISAKIRDSIPKDYFRKENIPSYVRQNPDGDTEESSDDNVNEDVAKKMNTLALDPHVSPLLAEDLSKLPHSYVLVCEFDILRDDGLLYVHRLRQAGVDVEFSYVKNHAHSFMTFADGPMYKGTVPEWDKIFQFLKKNL